MYAPWLPASLVSFRRLKPVSSTCLESRVNPLFSPHSDIFRFKETLSVFQAPRRQHSMMKAGGGNASSCCDWFSLIVQLRACSSSVCKRSAINYFPFSSTNSKSQLSAALPSHSMGVFWLQCMKSGCTPQHPLRIHTIYHSNAHDHLWSCAFGTACTTEHWSIVSKLLTPSTQVTEFYLNVI